MIKKNKTISLPRWLTLTSAVLAVLMSYICLPIKPHILAIRAGVANAYHLGSTLNTIYDEALCTHTNQSVHNVDNMYPEARILQQNHDIIFQEYETLRQKHNGQISTFQQLDSSQQLLESWQVLWLKLYGLNTCLPGEFPRTVELVRASGLPVQSIMISRLAAGDTLPRHTGPTNGVLRLLMAIHTSSTPEYPYLEVWDTKNVGQSYTEKPHRLEFQLGELVVFDDSYVHASHNPTSDERIVLWLDLERRDFKGWREWLWNKLIFQIIRFIQPPPIPQVVTRTNQHFCSTK